MNRTHKLARGDHDDLSQRVAHQMRDVINPGASTVATERPGLQHRRYLRSIEPLRQTAHVQTLDDAKMVAYS